MAAQLGLPPGFRFVPTDEEVVGLHLLPRIQDQPLPPNDIIVDDPLSAPPWALLEKHGRKQEAFFFAVGQALNARGNRQKRTCKGHGTWEGQGKRKRQQEGKEKESKKRMCVSVGGSTKEIEWDKYALNFHEHGVKGSTGWVMHEYSITSPPKFAQSPMRVYCIRQSGHGKNAKKYNRDEQDWGSDEEDEDEVDDATLATTWCAAEEDPALFVGAGNDEDLPALVEDDATTWCAAVQDPALFVGEYLLAPQAKYVTSRPVAVADVVNVIPADGTGAGAGNDQDLPALVDDDATTWCAAEEDPALFIDWSEKWG